MDDSAIERWQDPPPAASSGGRIDYAPIIDTLRRRPRTWALVFEEVSIGRPALFRKAAPGLEIVGRNYRQVDGKDRCDIYARHMPSANGKSA